ncbi:UNKNOWN [Stylonychia lemnae]|uniref:Uncharacterized protein n=1 Tax=Stylonychia lemnae TaxID=5949 RepID=A0A078BEL2_STYLE|nr:UNKNOWN [Stylonychia lemnae]|eukprot:CDW91592.1 UNKNOWN [Stylonychia lemnae]
MISRNFKLPSQSNTQYNTQHSGTPGGREYSFTDFQPDVIKQVALTTSSQQDKSKATSTKNANNIQPAFRSFKERMSIFVHSSNTGAMTVRTASQNGSNSARSKQDFQINLQQLRESYNDYQQQETLKKREVLERQISVEKRLEQVKSGIKTLFERYSSHNQQYGYMKFNQFKDIFTIAQLYPEKLNQEQLEIIYYQSKRKDDSALVYESFLKTILTISKFLFPQKQPIEATISIYEEYLKSQVTQENIREINTQTLNKTLWEKDVRLIKSLASKFAKVYPLYWKNELIIKKEKSRFENEQDSQKELQRFVRDFNLVFLLQNKNIQKFNRLLDESLNQKTDFLGIEVACLEQGHTFKFSMLINFLLKCAHAFYPINGLSELLEKLEFSKGTEQVRALGLRVSFINHYDVRIEEDNVMSGVQSQFQKRDSQMNFFQQVGGGNRNNKQPNQLEMSMMNSREFALKLNKYVGQLEKIYQQYAIEASSRLGMNNFIKFLKEYDLLSEQNHTLEIGKINLNKNGIIEEYHKVSVNRVQIIFKQTTKSKNAKLNFEQFLYALKQLSTEVYPFSGADENEYENLEKTMNEMQRYENSVFFKLISRNIIKKIPVRQNKYDKYKEVKDQEGAQAEEIEFIAEDKIKDMLDAMQDVDIQGLIKIFYNQIQPLMRLFQSTLEGLMDFEATLRFCQTYDIFPSLCSKVKLKELFTVFASFHQQSMINKVGKRKALGEEGKRYIDNDLLIELLVTIGLSQKTLSSQNQENQYEGYFIKV